MLRLWNLNLIVGTFVLTILGTFLTRSGIISSVHAFTTGTIGYYFLAFISIILLSALAMVAGNSERLRTTGRLDSAASRETVFLLNNLFLTAFMFTVLVGTLFPLVAEAIRGVKVSVGVPFFNRMSLPLIVTLLFLMGVGPALPWKSASKEEVRTKLLPPLAGAVLLALVALVAGARNVYAVLAFAFVGYSATANLREFWIGMRARHTAHGEGWGTALVRLVLGNRRRYGGYVAHIGVFLAALGIAASSTFRTENEATLKPGETLTVAGRTVRLKEVWGREEKQRSVIGATLEVLAGGQVTGTLEPHMNFYPTSQQPVPTPDVRSSVAGDLYANLQAFRPDGSNATVKLIYEPMVPWIWFGGLVVVFGALIGISPRRRSGQVFAAASISPTPVSAGTPAGALPLVREEPA
jgi:cytochrome c-type biogenesis protein CcmF